MAVEVAGNGAGIPEKLRLEWENYRRMLARLAVLGGIAFGLIFVNHMHQHDFRMTRPPQVNQTELLYQGVTHTQEFREFPRPLMLHTLEIDVQAVDFFVSPPLSGKGQDTRAGTVSDFLRKNELQFAVNANFFKEFKPHIFFPLIRPWKGELVEALGLVISDEIIVSEGEEGYPALCIFDDRAEIHLVICPEGTGNAIAGNQQIIINGKAVWGLDNIKRHPRHVAAISADGQTIWFIIIDGRQPGYSEGVTLAELGQILEEMDVAQAIVLDGGGSATMVTENRGTLNAPVQNGMPMLRVVGTVLGGNAKEIPRD